MAIVFVDGFDGPHNFDEPHSTGRDSAKAIRARHPVHATLPSGFAYATERQEDEYWWSGSVNGAAKVCFVKVGDLDDVPRLAVRLRPPRSMADVNSPIVLAQMRNLGVWSGRDDDLRARDWYIDQYNLGFSAGRRGSTSKRWESSETPHAWDDGYLDAVKGLPKWHVTYCPEAHCGGC